jgi:hypothetical protein
MGVDVDADRARFLRSKGSLTALPPLLFTIDGLHGAEHGDGAKGLFPCNHLAINPDYPSPNRPLGRYVIIDAPVFHSTAPSTEPTD